MQKTFNEYLTQTYTQQQIEMIKTVGAPYVIQDRFILKIWTYYKLEIIKKVISYLKQMDITFKAYFVKSHPTRKSTRWWIIREFVYLATQAYCVEINN